MNIATDILSISKLRGNIFESLKKVISDSLVLTVKSKTGNVVIMSESDFNGWKETLYLMSSPANAKRLQDAIDSANRGEFDKTFNSIEEFDEYTEKLLKDNGL